MWAQKSPRDFTTWLRVSLDNPHPVTPAHRNVCSLSCKILVFWSNFSHTGTCRQILVKFPMPNFTRIRSAGCYTDRHVNICARMRTCTSSHTQGMHASVHTHTHTHTHIHTYIHTYTHTHTHIYIHTYIHTHTHTHTSTYVNFINFSDRKRSLKFNYKQDVWEVVYKAKQYTVDLRFASSNKKVGGRRQLSDVAPHRSRVV
jgi:hypothetical protein